MDQSGAEDWYASTAAWRASPAAVPEPASLGLMLAGLTLVGLAPPPQAALIRAAMSTTKKAARSSGLFHSPAASRVTRDARDQRSPIGLTVRGAAPANSWRGRPILYSGSEIISFNWAIQPTVRASAKLAVNRLVGMPMARCTMPE